MWECTWPHGCALSHHLLRDHGIHVHAQTGSSHSASRAGAWGSALSSLGLCLRGKVSLVWWKDGKWRKESRTKSGTSSPNTDGWLQALAASHVPRVNGILVLYLPELITNPGQACQIIDLIHQLLLLFSSKNSSFRSLTPGTSDMSSRRW